jgi:hypothetical protein
VGDLDFNTYGLSVGQWLAFRPRLTRRQRAWRWIKRVVFRRKPQPAGFARIVRIEPTTLTLDRPLNTASGELFVSTFHKNGAPDAE